MISKFPNTTQLVSRNTCPWTGAGRVCFGSTTTATACLPSIEFNSFHPSRLVSSIPSESGDTIDDFGTINVDESRWVLQAIPGGIYLLCYIIVNLI